MSLTTLMRTCRLSCLWLVCQSALKEDDGFAFSADTSQTYPFTDWLTANCDKQFIKNPHLLCV